MSLFIDQGMALLAGVAMYLLVPLLIAAVANRYTLPKVDTGGDSIGLGWWTLNLTWLQSATQRLYTGHALRFLGDTIWVVRGNRLLPTPTQYVTDISMGGIYRTREGGEDKYYLDPDELAPTWNGFLAGIAHTDRNIIYNLRWALVAERFDELVRRDEWAAGDRRKAYFAFDPGRRLVDAGKAVWAIQEDAGPRLGEEIDRLVEIENSFYNTYRRRFVQTMEWITLFGAGLGGMFIARKLLGTLDGGGGGVTVPLVLWVMPI